MRITFVTQWYPPEPGTVVAQDIALGLAGLGHQVDVLTGFPNYPTGRLMPGYRMRPYQCEHVQPNLTVHRAPLYPNHDPSVLPRVANYLSFTGAATLLDLAKVPKGDVTLVYSSPATSAIPALAMRLFRGVPIVLLVQDVWPDSVLDASFVPGRLAGALSGVLSAFCRLCYASSAAVAVISPGMVGLLEGRGVGADKLHFTPNWISDSHLEPKAIAGPEARSLLGLPAGRSFIYAGNFGDLQELPTVVAGFAQVPDAHLVLVGDGVMRPALEAQIAELGASNIHLLSPKPLDQIGAYLAACDVQLVSLRDTPLMRVTMPSKTQTALASARPVLVCAAGDSAELVTGGGAGWAANPGDPVSIAGAVKQVMALDDAELRDIGGRARQLYEQNFSPAVGPRRIERVLKAVTGERHG